MQLETSKERERLVAIDYQQPGLTRRDFVKGVGIGLATLKLAGCGGTNAPQIVSWPIAEQVYTTAQQQVWPVALSSSVRQLHPGDVALYAQYQYSAWTVGGPLHHVVRTGPGSRTIPGRPTRPGCCTTSPSPTFTLPTRNRPRSRIYMGWSAPYGHGSSGKSSAYSPILLSTPQVLDAAIQTINALHETSAL